MREILYRIKSDNGEWLYGYPVMRDDYCYFYHANDLRTSCVSDLSSLTQFIGLTDLKGTKIFEGDIIRVNDGNDEIYVVERECDVPGGCWAESGYVLNRIWQSGYIHFTNTIDDHGDECQVMVIGNVYDNPEMIV